MASRKATRAYLDGFATARSVFDLDSLTVDEVLGALDADRDGDPCITPWKRGYRAAIRSAFGH
jgi:hypothetical protein